MTCFPPSRTCSRRTTWCGSSAGFTSTPLCLSSYTWSSASSSPSSLTHTTQSRWQLHFYDPTFQNNPQVSVYCSDRTCTCCHIYTQILWFSRLSTSSRVETQRPTCRSSCRFVKICPNLDFIDFRKTKAASSTAASTGKSISTIIKFDQILCLYMSKENKADFIFNFFAFQMETESRKTHVWGMTGLRESSTFDLHVLTHFQKNTIHTWS